MARKLTDNEIENILDFIQPNMNIPYDTAISIMIKNKDRLRKQLVDEKVYPEIIPELKKEMTKEYNLTMIQPGESVGVVCAQSIGEKQTQTTLNSFHKAGQCEKTMTVGVPRFQELLNATRDPKIINCKVFFKEAKDTVRDLRNLVGNSIVEITLGKLSKNINIIMSKEDSPWYPAFRILQNDKFSKFPSCISIDLDIDLLFEYKLTLKQIANRIDTEYDDLFCVFSPDSIGKLDIFVDISNITLPEKRILFIDDANAPVIYMEEVVVPLLKNMYVCGIEGIKHIFYTRENNEWIVETEGSNFNELLALDIIDMERTISNNVWDIYHTLGIEAAREFLIEEYMSIMEGINICHTKLLVERMTFSGTISSISRYTMRKETSGPLSKASFEETMGNFLDAASQGSIESTNGVSASIICGKRSNIGTGMIDLKMDFSRLPEIIPKFS
jgi:DNA-directed RNA polymerase beta' subunit